MTWFAQMRGMAADLGEEFGTECVFTPMIARPNERMRVDPSRVVFTGSGIFAEPPIFAGDGSARAGAIRKDGLEETMISSTLPSLSVILDDLPWRPTQGDQVYLPELRRRFRFLAPLREMAYRTRYTLEELGKIPAQ
jgi:hypothetical protein